MANPKRKITHLIPLPLYPALKQEDKDRITFYWPNTAKDQRHIRKLVKLRAYHFGIVKAARTIVYDIPFMRKATLNLKRAKKISCAEIHLCEPIVFGLVQKWLYILKRKSITDLELSFTLSDKNGNISQFFQAIDKLTKVQNLSISLESAQGCDISANMNQFIKHFTAFFEQNMYRYKRLNLSFKGKMVYILRNVASNLRHWNPNMNLYLVPEEIKGLEIGENIIPKRKVNFLNIYFYNLKNYSSDSLNKFIQNIQIFHQIGTLRLIMNKFEITPERMALMDNFFQGIVCLNSLQVINYYLKFYKMNYQGLFNFLSKRGELNKFTFGFLPLSDKIANLFSESLGKLHNLRELSLYVDINSLIEEKNSTFWNFFSLMKNLKKLELILTCKTSIITDDPKGVEDVKSYIEGILAKVNELSELQDLFIMIPELEIDFGESFNNLVLRDTQLKAITIDCAQYNLNYLYALKDLGKLKQINVKVFLPIQIFFGKENDLKILKGDNFRIEVYNNSYSHFSEMHERFYRRFI